MAANAQLRAFEFAGTLAEEPRCRDFLCDLADSDAHGPSRYRTR
jgi:hypothetical protein